MRRLLASVLTALALTVVAPTTALAQDDTPTTTIPESQHIIPEPNSGTAPTDSGDRGGALQTVVFAIMLAGVGVIGVLVVRESRKARAARGY